MNVIQDPAHAAALDVIVASILLPTGALHQVQFEVIFQQLTHTLMFIYGWQGLSSEEVLDAALASLHALMGSSVFSEGKRPFCSAPMRSAFGHSFSVVFGLATVCRSVTRHSACARALRLLCEAPAAVGTDVLRVLLPGIASRLAGLAWSDERPASALLIEVLGAYRSLLLGCLRDAANGPPINLATSPNDLVRDLQQTSATTRASDDGDVAAQPSCTALRYAHERVWLDETLCRLKPLLSRTCAAAAYGGWRARLGLTNALRSLLMHCLLSLQPCVPMLLEHAYTMTRDPYPQVAAAAAAMFQAIGARPLLATLVRDGFDTQLHALQACARGVDEVAKAHAFAVLSAQVEFATRDLWRLLSRRLGALSAALFGALAMHEAHPGLAKRIVWQRREKDVGSSKHEQPGETSAARLLGHRRYLPKAFVHLRSARAVEASTRLCKRLGELGSLTALTQQLLLVTHTSALPRPEALWVLDCALCGATRAQRRGGSALPMWTHGHVAVLKSKKALPDGGAGEKVTTAVDTVAEPVGKGMVDVKECVLMLLSELLEPSVWHAESAHGARGSLLRQHSTVIEREALLQVVGSAYELLLTSSSGLSRGVSSQRVGGCSMISPVVQAARQKLLLPLLEHLGDEVPSLSSAAELTLFRLSATVDESTESVAQLLEQSADLMLDLLGGRLLRVRPYDPRTAQLVQTVIEHGSQSALPHEHDILSSAMRFVDDLAPLVDATPIAIRRKERAAFLTLDLPPRSSLLPVPFALQPSISHAHFGWLRALHALVDAGLTPKAQQTASRNEADWLGAGGCASERADKAKRFGREHVFGSDKQNAFFIKLVHHVPSAALASGTDGTIRHSAIFSLLPCEEGVKVNAGAAFRTGTGDEEEGPAGTFALEALERVEALLLAGPPAAVHVLLDVLACILAGLENWPRALPALYPLWASLMQLMGEDLSVALHAMRVFASAARAVGDELSSRVIGDAIAKLVRTLARSTDAAGERADGTALGLWQSTAAEAADAGDATEAGGVCRGEDRSDRVEEGLLAASDCLRALCVSKRAMRPKVLSVLRATSPLLAPHRSERVQAAATSLCCRLTWLDPNAAWLFFALGRVSRGWKGNDGHE